MFTSEGLFLAGMLAQSHVFPKASRDPPQPSDHAFVAVKA